MSTLANHHAICGLLNRNPDLTDPLIIIVHDPETHPENTAATVYLHTIDGTDPGKAAIAWMRALDDGQPTVTYRQSYVDITIRGHYAPHCVMVIRVTLIGAQAKTMYDLAPGPLDTDQPITPELLEQAITTASQAVAV